MDQPQKDFLASVLGPDGANALLKAAARSDGLSKALVPRTILAWIESASVYEGEIPGSPGTQVAFEKSEKGFSGEIMIKGEIYEFQDESVFHLSALAAVALGLDGEGIASAARDAGVVKLGKSIEFLAKARRISAEYEARKKDKKVEESLEKGGGAAGGAGTGAPHAPTAPTPPTPPTSVAPTLPRPAPPKPPKAPVAPGAAKPPSIKFGKSEIERPCVSCGVSHFAGNEFVGCVCFRALAKSVEVTNSAEGSLTLKFDPSEWGRAEILTFLESVGR